MYTQAEKQQIAQTIINQMGGTRKLMAMVSAANFGFDTESNGDVSLRFNFKGSRKHNICKVILNSDDTYTFQLWYYNKRTLDCTMTYELTEVYCDMLIDLFEGETGLYLSL